MPEPLFDPVRDIFHAMQTEKINGHPLSDVVGGSDPEWVAHEVVTAIEEFAQLSAEDSILDVGCGCGRIAAALTQYLSPTSSYLGVDIVPGLIEFAKKFITPRYPHFQFVLLNESNKTYDAWRSPSKEQGVANLTDALTPKVVDLAISVSLFTHLDYVKAAQTLSLIHYALKKGGRAFVTLFVLDGPARDGIEKKTAFFGFSHRTPSGKLYAEKIDDPTLAVAYDMKTLEALIGTTDFQLERLVCGYWSTGQPGKTFQDALILRKI